MLFRPVRFCLMYIGLMILLGIIGSTLLWGNLTSVYVWVVLIVTIGFGLIGYWIDTKYDSSPKGVLTGAILGIIGGGYNLIRESLMAAKAAGDADAEFRESAGVALGMVGGAAAVAAAARALAAAAPRGAHRVVRAGARPGERPAAPGG